MTSGSHPRGEVGYARAGCLHDEGFDGNVAAAARFFGKDRRQVYRWMERLGLAPPAYPDARDPDTDDA